MRASGGSAGVIAARPGRRVPTVQGVGVPWEPDVLLAAQTAHDPAHTPLAALALAVLADAVERLGYFRRLDWRALLGVPGTVRLADEYVELAAWFEAPADEPVAPGLVRGLEFEALVEAFRLGAPARIRAALDTAGALETARRLHAQALAAAHAVVLAAQDRRDAETRARQVRRRVAAREASAARAAAHAAWRAEVAAMARAALAADPPAASGPRPRNNGRPITVREQPARNPRATATGGRGPETAGATTEEPTHG